MRSTMRARPTLFLLVALTFNGMRVGAQDVAELTRRLDAEVSQRNVATAALMAYRRRALPPRLYSDTATILDGTVRIVTDRALVSLVRDAGALTEAFIRSRAGGELSLLRGAVFAVWADSLRRTQHGVIVTQRENDHNTSEAYVYASRPALARALEERAQRLLGGGGKVLFERWLGSGLPVDTATSADWRALRLELVSSQTGIARRCFDGDLRACQVTLGLISDADPVTSWYDSATRRVAVTEASKKFQFDRRAVAACIAGNDAECITLMRTMPALAGWSTAPGSGRARTALVQRAFVMGGSGALARAVASPDTPADVISAIAKAPIESVVAQWQRLARDGGIESEIATPVVAVTAVGWMLLMGALSLRSPRWR